MHPMTPPRSKWKTVFLPGLLLGVLLALLQVALISGLSVLSFQHQFHSFDFLWWLLPLYLLMPTLFAFLTTVRTCRPATGQRVGSCAGITCAILLFGATILLLAWPQPDRPAHDWGIDAAIGVALFSTPSLFINALGVLLAGIGADLGSRRWRRG